jgi:hypothetical protein
MFEEKGDYLFDNFEKFNEAYEILVGQGESLYSPGYFARYGVSRQLLYNWANRDKKIRRLIFSSEQSNYDRFIFIVESDVMEALKVSRMSK